MSKHSKLSYLCLLILTGFVSRGQSDKPNYDAELAMSLGADEGIKSYVFVILKTGSNKNEIRT